MTSPLRQLVLVRHAKAERPFGVADRDRPLAPRGLRNAQAAGEYLAHQVPRISVVLCSPARRAQQTWEVMSRSLAGSLQPPVSVVPELYHAGADDMLEVINQLDAQLRVAVLVGHEPAMSALTLSVAGPGSHRPSMRLVDHNFSTNGIAIVRAEVPWAELAFGLGILESYAAPRA